MRLMKRIGGAGMGTMGAVGLMTAIWPAVADVVAGLLVTVLGAGLVTLAVLSSRWARAELAWRREVHSMPPIDTTPYAVPRLAQLRESA